jgi:hypothetical protein
MYIMNEYAIIALFIEYNTKFPNGFENRKVILITISLYAHIKMVYCYYSLGSMPNMYSASIRLTVGPLAATSAWDNDSSAAITVCSDEN